MFYSVFVLWKYRLKCSRVMIHGLNNLLLNGLEIKVCVCVCVCVKRGQPDMINDKANEAKLTIGRYKGYKPVFCTTLATFLFDFISK